MCIDHICRYKGSTKTIDDNGNIIDGSGSIRVHSFQRNECSFHKSEIDITQCQSAYIQITEACEVKYFIENDNTLIVNSFNINIDSIGPIHVN